jgi:hypothetical protein
MLFDDSGKLPVQIKEEGSWNVSGPEKKKNRLNSCQTTNGVARRNKEDKKYNRQPRCY